MTEDTITEAAALLNRRERTVNVYKRLSRAGYKELCVSWLETNYGNETRERVDLGHEFQDVIKEAARACVQRVFEYNRRLSELGVLTTWPSEVPPI